MQNCARTDALNGFRSLAGFNENNGRSIIGPARIHTGNVCGDRAALRELEPGTEKEGRRDYERCSRHVTSPRSICRDRHSAELARRHGGWYAELISAKGQETADGSATAAMVVRYRLDSAPVIVDVGGGYGGGVTIRLKDNGIEPVSFVASWESIEKTKDGQLAFANKRAEVWWKFREALDPERLGNRIAARSRAKSRSLCSHMEADCPWNTAGKQRREQRVRELKT